MFGTPSMVRRWSACWPAIRDHTVRAVCASPGPSVGADGTPVELRLLDLFDVPAAALPTVVASTGPFLAASTLVSLPTPGPVTGVLGDSHAACSPTPVGNLAG